MSLPSGADVVLTLESYCALSWMAIHLARTTFVGQEVYDLWHAGAPLPPMDDASEEAKLASALERLTRPAHVTR